MKTDILIIGAGPTGLGAAHQLENAGVDWHLVEASPSAGGLASSFLDDNGFTWDIGGHVLFSHYKTFDQHMDEALGQEGWLQHERESWIWMLHRFIPYPFQNNLHRLPQQHRWECIKGLIDAFQQTKHNMPPPRHFEDWMLRTMGRGITDLFLRPYNEKVWACPPSSMDYNWLGERVSVPSLDEAIRSVCLEQDHVSWGPNNQFRFPRQGGTGAIWQALCHTLPTDRVTLGCRIHHIDPQQHIAYGDNRTWKYKKLISTMPLNHLIGMTSDIVHPENAARLRFSGTRVFGIGLTGMPPAPLKTKCWMYFPEAHSPYYRITVFSNYSPNNVPLPGEQWSLMAEVAESTHRSNDPDRLADHVVDAMIADNLIPNRSSICSFFSYYAPCSYPTPFLGRDALVHPCLRAFENRGIYSRGRMGAWLYEVGNMDHSYAQGYECAQRLYRGGGAEMEPTLHSPNLINSRYNA